jgi:RimJ/RimL family protein N-acetyltransferase
MGRDFLHHVRVRRSVPADAPAIVEAIESICAEGIYFQTDTFVPDRHWETVLHRPESAPHLLLAVAEYNKEIIGTVRLFSSMSDSKDRHVAELGIFVLDPHRERGVGRRLLAYALDWAANQGLKKITLSVFSDNTRAIRLYKSVGFTLEGTRKMQYNVRGVYVDEILMAKFL